MNFLQSKTAINLARSFAGESQARNRYTIYAEQARNEQQEYLARIFEQTADNERIHAKEFLEKIQQYAGEPVKNLEIDSGYPYPLGNTEQNLMFAAEGELDEHKNAYPAFAAIAQEEGYPEAAQLWKMIAVIEGLHHNVFQEAHFQLTSGTLYRKQQPVVWRCINCGYVYTGTEPWQVCPVCGKPHGWVEGYVDTHAIPKG